MAQESCAIILPQFIAVCVIALSASYSSDLTLILVDSVTAAGSRTSVVEL